MEVTVDYKPCGLQSHKPCLDVADAFHSACMSQAFVDSLSAIVLQKVHSEESCINMCF